MTLMTGDIGLIKRVGAGYDPPPPSCSGNTVNETYTNDMTKLLSRLQLSAPLTGRYRATYHEGSVAGTAMCGGPQQCSECLSVTQIKLIVYCKGRESGTTWDTDRSGYGVCQMYYSPATKIT